MTYRSEQGNSESVNFRYYEKIKILQCKCPYTVDESAWVSGHQLDELLPEVTSYDLYRYLLHQKSPYTENELNN